jgi:ABC-type lipoprotein release transport system permease subunit
MSTSRIARRNLGRNRKRTALALGAIALAQCGVLLIDGLIKGYDDAMVDAVTGPMLGHVQLHAPAWRAEQNVDASLEHLHDKLARLRAVPGVARASARIYAPALLARGDQGFVGVVMGVDPGQERGATGLLGASATVLERSEVLLGAGLAQAMATKVGDELAIVGQAADGSIANDLYRVVGTVRSQVDLLQSTGVIMNLADAQQLFVMEDQAHEISVHGHDSGSASALAAAIASRPELAGTEVKAWTELAPELTTMLRLHHLFTWVVVLLVFVAAAAGVANTMLMATFERNHELGMLLALGCAPARIVAMIALEALMLGLLGVLLGSALGVSATFLIRLHGGIDIASLGGRDALERLTFAGMNCAFRIVPRCEPLTVLGGLLAVTFTVFLSALWPALHAARLQPVEAMRA